VFNENIIGVNLHETKIKTFFFRIIALIVIIALSDENFLKKYKIKNFFLYIYIYKLSFNLELAQNCDTWREPIIFKH
jgi:hypothetical protein